MLSVCYHPIQVIRWLYPCKMKMSCGAQCAQKGVIITFTSAERNEKVFWARHCGLLVTQGASKDHSVLCMWEWWPWKKKQAQRKLKMAHECAVWLGIWNLTGALLALLWEGPKMVPTDSPAPWLQLHPGFVLLDGHTPEGIFRDGPQLFLYL